MRLILVIAALVILTCGSVSATPPPCVAGTLATYIALGAGGCTAGRVVFANFTYSASAKGGALMIRADQIAVAPIQIVPAATGFSFSAPWSVSNAQSQDSIIKYTAVLPCGDTGLVEADLALGSSHVVDSVGSVTVRESTNVGTLSVFDVCTEGCQDKTSDSFQFNPVSVVLITDSVSLTGGAGGASLHGFVANLNLCIPCV